LEKYFFVLQSVNLFSLQKSLTGTNNDAGDNNDDGDDDDDDDDDDDLEVTLL